MQSPPFFSEFGRRSQHHTRSPLVNNPNFSLTDSCIKTKTVKKHHTKLSPPFLVKNKSNVPISRFFVISRPFFMDFYARVTYYDIHDTILFRGDSRSDYYSCILDQKSPKQDFNVNHELFLFCDLAFIDFLMVSVVFTVCWFSWNPTKKLNFLGTPPDHTLRQSFVAFLLSGLRSCPI